MHFDQLNDVKNDYGSTLDLVFTNIRKVHIDKAHDYLLPCDSYHPAHSISCLNHFTFPSLDTTHNFYDFIIQIMF